MKPVQLSPSVLAWARSFEAVVRCKSFTKAAQDLCITQGAVSQQVKQFELWARRPLLVRPSRTVVPTPEGRWLAATLTESMQAIEAALARVRTPDASDALMLSCSPSFAMKWLTPRLGDFYRALPSLGLQVTGDFSAVDAQRMAADGLAAALRFDLGAYADLDAREILDDYIVPVASPSFVHEHLAVMTARGLKPSLLLHDSQPWVGAAAYEEWAHWFSGAGLAPPRNGWDAGRQFNLSLLATEAALAGQGIAIGRLSLVLEDLLAGRLCMPLPHFVRSRASYHLVTSPRPPAALQQVRDWLLAQTEAFRQRRDRFMLETPGTAHRC